MMRRLLILPLVLVVAACPRDKKVAERDSIPVDTALAVDTNPTDLSDVKPNLPAAAPDTFTPRQPPVVRREVSGEVVPSAPAPLMAAVQREQAFTRFCFQEFGQKSDPSLRGNVAMLVTVGSSGITDARVGDSNWSSQSGRAVNRCLNERARQAWRLTPGAVKNGRYVVQLSFSGA